MPSYVGTTSTEFLALVLVLNPLTFLACGLPLMQFVIVASFDRVDPALMVEERVGLALKRCGVSITCEEGTLGPSNVGSAQRKRPTRPIGSHNKLHDYARTMLAVDTHRVFLFFFSLGVLRYGGWSRMCHTGAMASHGFR